MKQRLNKYIASATTYSRRKADALIAAGKVQVNDAITRQHSTQIEPDVDTVRVEGSLIRPNKRVYYVLNKPLDVVSTTHDPRGRKTVIDLIPSKPPVFPVGRLDMDTSGLLILTNDGALAAYVTHPSHTIDKTYVATVTGVFTEAELKGLQHGLPMKDFTARPAKIDSLTSDGVYSVLTITIHEGKNRQVRRMMQALNKPVVSLQRIAIGKLSLDALEGKQWMQCSGEYLYSSLSIPMPVSEEDDMEL